jgi:CheY-like chemotaxis protein
MPWTVLCAGDDASRILLYQSFLELDGHSVLVAASAAEALEVSKTRALDCAVIDHEKDGTSIASQIARARPGLPILFVSDRSELPFQIYAETGMPQGSHQKRPTVVTSKPANESGLGLVCFTPPPPEEASLFSCANSVDRI